MYANLDRANSKVVLDEGRIAKGLGGRGAAVHELVVEHYGQVVRGVTTDAEALVVGVEVVLVLGVAREFLAIMGGTTR